jgi:DNA-binding SARP family transcriptional activator
MTRAPPATPVLLELQLLGVPQVRLGDVVKLATRKALAALAYLALNGPSPRATLASLLWTRHSSDDARRNLRQELHRILATPAGPWLDTDGDLLRLVPGFVCDALQVRAAVAAGDLDTAVALYRGELLAGFELGGADAFSEWLQQQRASLAETWRGAARRVITAREAAGDLDAALQVAQMLVDHNPLDEPSVRDAIRLRHGRGDRAGALGQFDRLRNLLHDELGVAPEAETIALVKRVELTAPSPAAPTDASLPSLHPPLVGRDSAWQQLAAAASTVAVIEGDAGVGKTRLAQEFARAHGGVLLLKGREISRDTPLYPVAEALLTAYREDTAWFERLDPAWRAEVARLLPTLAGDEPSADLPYAEGRSRFLDGLANALLTAAAGGTLLFDDLQWFDASSAELLAHLARRSHRVRLLATARSEELPSNTAVQSALEALAREALLVRLPLTPLTEDEVLHLVRALSGSSGATVFSRRLHKATAGNALFILESLRDLFGAGVLWRDQNTWATRYDEETEDYRELPISTSVRDDCSRRPAWPATDSTPNASRRAPACPSGTRCGRSSWRCAPIFCSRPSPVTASATTWYADRSTMRCRPNDAGCCTGSWRRRSSPRRPSRRRSPITWSAAVARAKRCRTGSARPRPQRACTRTAMLWPSTHWRWPTGRPYAPPSQSTRHAPTCCAISTIR